MIRRRSSVVVAGFAGGFIDSSGQGFARVTNLKFVTAFSSRTTSEVPYRTPLLQGEKSTSGLGK